MVGIGQCPGRPHNNIVGLYCPSTTCEAFLRLPPKLTDSHRYSYEKRTSIVVIQRSLELPRGIEYRAYD
jgi:hypothetical protein